MTEHRYIEGQSVAEVWQSNYMDGYQKGGAVWTFMMPPAYAM